MSLRTAIYLCLALHTAAMLAIWWCLRAWMPPVMDSLRAVIGQGGVWIALIGLGLICADIAYWPRSEDGRRRSLLPRRCGRAILRR